MFKHALFYIVFTTYAVHSFSNPEVSVDENFIPPGFEDIVLSEKENWVDVYFMNQHIAVTQIYYKGDTLRIPNIKELINPIESIKNKQTVIKALTGKIKHNFNKTCTYKRKYNKKSKEKCNVLEPEIAEVIYDKSRTKLIIFVNENYIDDAYKNLKSGELLPSSSGFSFLNDFDAYINDRKDSQLRNLDMLTYLGYKEAYIDMKSTVRKSDTQTSRRRYNIQEIQAKANKYNKQYYSGWGRMQGSNFLSSKKYLGLGFQTTTDQISDKNSLYANPIELFLSNPSKIEIYRDDELLSAQNYSVGNTVIDTKSLPFGSYEILIRIVDDNGNVTEKVEYFVKNSSMPSENNPNYYFNLGVFEEMYDQEKKMLPTYSDKKFVQAGGDFRVSDHSFIAHNFILSRGMIYGEAEYNYIKNKYKISPVLSLTTNKDQGFGLRFGGPLFFGMLYNGSATRVFRNKNPVQTLRYADPFTTLKYRISNNLSLKLPYGSLSFGSNIFKIFNRKVSHRNSIRYNYSWNISKAYRANVGSLLTFQARETTLLFTLSFKFSEKNTTLNLKNIRSYEKEEGNKRVYQNTYNISPSWSGHHEDKYYGVAADMQKRHDNDRLQSKLSYEDSSMKIVPSLTYIRNSGKPSHIRNLRMGTGLAISGGNISLTNTKRSKQGILVTVNTKGKDGAFKVYLNGGGKHIVKGNSSIFIPAQPYRTYKISVSSKSNERFKVKEKIKMVTIYPGNVDHVEFNAYQIYALISQLVDETDTPISNASLEGGKFFDQTDESGNFQFDIRADQKELIFKTQSGEKCMAILPDQEVESGFLEIPKLVCKPMQILTAETPETKNMKVPSGVVEKHTLKEVMANQPKVSLNKQNKKENKDTENIKKALNSLAKTGKKVIENISSNL